MTNKLYKALYEAKIIDKERKTKALYEETPMERRVSDRPDIDGYWVYEEIEDQKEIDQLLAAKQTMYLRRIHFILLLTASIFVLAFIGGFYQYRYATYIIINTLCVH